MKIIPIPAPTDDAPLEPWVPFDHIDDQTLSDWTGGDVRGGGYVQGTYVTPDGMRVFIVEETGTSGAGGGYGQMTYIDLTSPLDLGTALPEFAVMVTSQSGEFGGVPIDIEFSIDGMQMYILRWSQVGVGASIHHYTLPAPWDMTGFDYTVYTSHFVFPSIIFGYTRNYIRSIAISEDGSKLYVPQPTLTRLDNNPTSKKGSLMVYELTTPHNIGSAVESEMFILHDPNIGDIDHAITVFSRRGQVDQFVMSGEKTVNFNFPNGLEDRTERDGGYSWRNGASYRSTRVHPWIRDRFTDFRGTSLGGSLAKTEGAIYSTIPG